MADGTAFPGSYQGDEGVRADREEMWKEYQEIRGRADSWNHTAHDMVDKNPRGAQVAATLTVAGRLEALTYLISKAKVF